MNSRRQPDLFAPSRKPRAARRKEPGDKLIIRRELRASLALYSPTGRAELPEGGKDALGIEQEAADG